jgi:DNA-binding NarL/FixJ family response regulator
MRRVLVADDHPALRASVRRVLEEHGFEVCAEAASAADSVAAAERERPDVCVLDVRMPGGGIAAAARIAAFLPETAIIMLTVSDSDDDLFAALRAGAQGYLLKDMDPARLPLALEGVLAGEAALPRALAARVLDEFRARRRRRRLLLRGGRGATLTDREWETLELLAGGLSTAEAAERLLVTPVTVRRHAASILKKLDVPDRRSLLQLLREPERHPTEAEGRTYPSAGRARASGAP